MKSKCLFFFVFLIIVVSSSYANDIRAAANYVEALISGNMPDLTDGIHNTNLTEERLAKMRTEIVQRYGFLKSFLDVETGENNTVTLYALMENGKLKFDVILDPINRILSLNYEGVEFIPSLQSTINISTKPEQASVYFNDVFQGWSPLTLVKNTGKSKISIWKNGFERKIQYLQLSDGDVIDLAINLQPSVLSTNLDFKIGNSMLLNSFDYGGWFPADWVSDNIRKVEIVELFKTEGKKALMVEFAVSDPGEVVVQYPYSIEPRDIDQAELFFMDVYWGLEQEALLYLAFQNGENWTWYETEAVTLRRGMNYSLPLNPVVVQDMNQVKVLNIKLYLPSANMSGVVYFDNLRVFKPNNFKD